jgi:hypothetical protein
MRFPDVHFGFGNGSQLLAPDLRLDARDFADSPAADQYALIDDDLCDLPLMNNQPSPVCDEVR